MPGNRPEMSVILSVYNPSSRKEIFLAIKSILQQTFRDFEFIVYDDGSDPEIAAEADTIKGLDDRIRVIKGEENRGLAYSLNKCIELARGRYIARMDADDISLPDRLLKQYEFLEEHPEYQWCGCNVELFDDEGVWGKLRYPEIPRKEDFLSFSPFAHPTVVFRKELFTNGVQYRISDETARCEDFELFMRLSQMGLKGYNLQEFLFQYRDDRYTMKKQKMKYRRNEAKVRYRGFKKMGLLSLKGWLYVARPIAGGIIPSRLITAYKRSRYL